MKYISVTYKIGILVSLLFWVGCKEDNKTSVNISDVMSNYKKILKKSQLELISN